MKPHDIKDSFFCFKQLESPSSGPDPNALGPTDIAPSTVNRGAFSRVLLTVNEGITISLILMLLCWRQKNNCPHAVSRHLVETRLEKASGGTYFKRSPDWLVAALII